MVPPGAALPPRRHLQEQQRVALPQRRHRQLAKGARRETCCLLLLLLSKLSPSLLFHRHRSAVGRNDVVGTVVVCFTKTNSKSAL